MYGLIGKSLTHSFSPEIHKLFGKYEYALFPLENEEALRDFLRSGDWKGLNVTIPYKQTVMKYLDQIDDRALSIGSVNTVCRRNGKLIGFNTDYDGMRLALESKGIRICGKKAVILGSGGTSLTARAVLKDGGAKEIIVVSRSGEMNYSHLDQVSDADILINTTPVGMFPDNGRSAVDLSVFSRLEGVLDVIYNPFRTKLILDAESAGIPCTGGLRMLVAQAAAACARFLDHQVDRQEAERIYGTLLFEKTNIILIGMPGSGKTTAARLLRKMTGRECVDIDEVIEKRIGRTADDIIRHDGEDAFRTLETDIVRETGKRNGIIIATGGGVVTRPENYLPLAQNGRIYYLDRDVEDLPTEGRPLSQTRSLTQMYKERLPLYSAFADVRIPFCIDKKHRASMIWEDFRHAYSHS